MAKSAPRIAIVGGGLGGLAAAALLQAEGYNVHVYEQAQVFTRLGAGIHLGPNLMKVLRRIGIADRVIETGASPNRWVSRKWDDGRVLLDHEIGEPAARRYGVPYMMVHRGDFHARLFDAVRPESISLGKRVVEIDPTGSVAKLGFEDGTKAEADIIIGADGVRSRMREVLLGPEEPQFSGQVAFRSVFPAALLGDYKMADCVKWWGEDRIFLVYYITRAHDEMFLVTASPEAEWPHPTSSVPGDLGELRAAFQGFHPEVQRIASLCPQATKWAMYDHEPFPLWSRGRIVLLGDACHPMLPFMGQGAAMAIEDAAMLTRCLKASPTDFEFAFQLYELNRKSRTASIQDESRKNVWLKETADPDWVFGYDVTEEPLIYPDKR
ncbi:MAG TPA: FAD-dependent monooxygenase [Hypericibacter adhaerens]|jgi:6-hydroxynicotinate 3-monooxygenase|uniref:Monooxygenase n=1 Tax=Hypericibacter adhaerens TaxID=2602016 RepID=A0A5J6MU06_9PROT|nr:FAD-dependent monooxygenase [Hypericibacter adhaerens]QEX21108.1 monooxygenase [Hypericibacter adhaerens]HWA44149.1 FAD-dependent monooxygenase [Hypericibacter adhaerens]